MRKLSFTVRPERSDPFYIVSYYKKWVTTTWTHSTIGVACVEFYHADIIYQFLITNFILFYYKEIAYMVKAGIFSVIDFFVIEKFGVR